ncbi:MAG: hypothetical protein Q8L28_01365, partial [bacterium]|nr:hypothetical protein [bacterium]
MNALLPKISPELIARYKEEIGKNSSASTLKRKSISLNKFFDWAEDKGKVEVNPNKVVGTIGKSKSKKVGLRVVAVLGFTTGLIILIVLILGRLQFPIQFINNFAQESDIQTLPENEIISATPAEKARLPDGQGAWNLFAKLKLTDESGSPQVGSQSLTFKLYKAETDTSAVWTSETENVITDSNGSALISLDSVPTNLFWENNQLFLEPILEDAQGQSLRMSKIPVSTASTPVIGGDGNLILAGQSPAIKAESGNFLIEGQAVTLKTADGADGNIEINPDGKGIVHFLFEGTGKNFLNAQAPNLTSGSLYYGIVANNSSGTKYDLLKLQSGSKPTTKLSVDGAGNTYIGGELNVKGDIQTGGVDRLTASGALTNITGYQQNSGNFAISQTGGNYASIIKTGSALSDVLSLTLDERTAPNASTYSALVLKRYNGVDDIALYVDEGNARFDGQVQLGRFTSNPGATGQGSLVFNTADNSVYFWNGSAWVSVGTASTVPFSGITSGTNTTAAMVVGSGASLNYTGTGTINA